MDYLAWMDKTRRKIESLSVSTEFCLKDLFEGTQWCQLSVGERLNFGKYFKNEVLEGNVSNISYIGKAPNNSAKYRKERG